MKSNYFLLILIAIVLILGGIIAWDFFILQKEGNLILEEEFLPPPSEEELYSEEKSKEIAKNLVLKNAPTYKFDGFSLEYKEIVYLWCPFCYEFIFTFQSRHAGYGDRTGKILAQVITSHTIAITVRKGEITRAITDEKYDEIKREFLTSGSEETKEKKEESILEQEEFLSDKEKEIVCENLCGDGICQEIVCMAIGCPCAETTESCPQDCQ